MLHSFRCWLVGERRCNAPRDAEWFRRNSPAVLDLRREKHADLNAVTAIRMRRDMDIRQGNVIADALARRERLNEP